MADFAHAAHFGLDFFAVEVVGMFVVEGHGLAETVTRRALQVRTLLLRQHRCKRRSARTAARSASGL